jgi:hypothetical protein
LLLLDANREPMFLKSTKNFIRLAKTEMKTHAEYIRVSELSDLGAYKFELLDLQNELSESHLPSVDGRWFFLSF